MRFIQQSNHDSSHLNRVIIHVDLDAFYAQVEQVRLGLDPSIPLCVQQWQGLIAVNYPARAAGIKRHVNVEEAKKLCPNVVFVHVATYAQGESQPKYHTGVVSPKTHKVSLDVYRNASRKIMKIFKEECPKFQRASIDEAYLDVTDQVNEIIKQNEWPEWDHTEGPLVEWGNVAAQATEPAVTTSRGIRDLQLYVACQLSQKIRDRVFQDLGYTCSTGIAANKTLAKLISALNKPNKQTVLRDEGILQFMKTIPMSKIKGLGGKLGSEVERHFDVNMASDLWQYSEQQLQAKLGAQDGAWLYSICRGICTDEVKEVSANKSMAACKSLNPPIRNEAEGRKWLGILASEIFTRVFEDNDISKRWPRTLVLHVKGKIERSLSCSFPPKRDTNSPDVISRKAWSLFDDAKHYPCTRLALTASNLEPEVDMPTISNWFKAVEPSTSDENLELKQNSVPSTDNTTSAFKKDEVESTIEINELDADQVKIICDECQGRLDPNELDSHRDYHVALKLLEEDRADLNESIRLSDRRVESTSRQTIQSALQERKPRGDKKTSKGKATPQRSKVTKVTNFFKPY